MDETFSTYHSMNRRCPAIPHLIPTLKRTRRKGFEAPPRVRHVKWLNTFSFPLIFAFILLVFFSGCSPFKIIVLKDPLTPEEHLNLGVAYERNGELDHAIKEYKSASQKLPVAYLYLGNAHFQKNEWQSAEACYKKAIKKEPQNADAYNNLAWLYYIRHKNLGEGEMFALKAIQLNPAKEHIYRDTLEKIRELRKSQQ